MLSPPLRCHMFQFFSRSLGRTCDCYSHLLPIRKNNPSLTSDNWRTFCLDACLWMNLSGNGDAIPGLDRGVVGMLKGLGTHSLTYPVMKLLLLFLVVVVVPCCCCCSLLLLFLVVVVVVVPCCCCCCCCCCCYT